MKTAQLKKGFTLIELLVVIGILAVLLAITLIAINPAKQFKQANDTKRRSDVNAILNAINQYMADNKGALPIGITIPSGIYPTDAVEISNAGADLCGSLVPKYIAALPVDPLTGGGAAISNPCPATYSTNYKIVKSATDNRITVGAPAYEGTEVITVTR